MALLINFLSAFSFVLVLQDYFWFSLNLMLDIDSWIEDNHLIKQELDYDKTTIQNNISYIQQFTEDNNIKANILLIPDACYGEEQLLPKGAVNMDEKEMIQSIQQDLQDQTILKSYVRSWSSGRRMHLYDSSFFPKNSRYLSTSSNVSTFV